ncbi:MAG: DVU_1553 family AMP-dependent CoA ligase [Dehalobacterium sp.]
MEQSDMADSRSFYQLDKWIKEKIGDNQGEFFSLHKLREYQIGKIRDTISYAKANSIFYQRKYEHVNPEDIIDFTDLSIIPFTTEEDIINNGTRLVCVNQKHIHRIVTLNTSGTMGESKRIFFTEEDQELTKDYFHHGMQTINGSGDRVLILMPGERPGSVGDLLLTALGRFNCQGIPYGQVDDYDQVLNMIFTQKINGIVGIPIQVYRLARLKKHKYPEVKTEIKSILLSSDYASSSLIKAIKSAFQCEVFDHYGMTEMGLGGGLECHEHNGYHLREADMYFEIIDPDTEKVVPDGVYGEFVFTTLTRKGMPLIRYRTGDYSRFIDRPCSCGTKLKTLENISFRLKKRIFLNQEVLTINLLDDLLFNHDRLLDYEAVLTKEKHKNRLTIFASFYEKVNAEDFDQLNKILMNSKIIAKLINEGELLIEFAPADQKTFDYPIVGKRNIRLTKIKG